MPYRVLAINLATTSTNKIHDDAVAQQYGFKGGLVPGVEVYSYLTHPLVEQSRDWLTQGSMHIRLRRPVYDGRWVTVTVTDEADGSLAQSSAATMTEPSARWRKAICAATRIRRLTTPRASPRFPPACVDAIASTRRAAWNRRRAVRRPPRGRGIPRRDRRNADGVPRREDRAPGWLLRRANRILSRNVEMGPWMHVESTVQQLDLVFHEGPRRRRLRTRRPQVRDD